MNIMQSRPPVVAILGHVDHGKTTLLDYIRKSRLTQKEHGGITQKIGAYEVKTAIKGYSVNKITFIDTPGHEAFSKLRARGANVADIAILIIDAKDSVMPQTIESISHIRQAKIPFIVALNKIDLPEANPEKVKNDLMKYEVLVEDRGGGIPLVEISAKTGKGVDHLLEIILLLASDLNLNFSPKNFPKALVIETKKDKRGLVISAIIKDGILQVGDKIVVDGYFGKIRSLYDDLGHQLQQVVPSKPFELLGLDQLPAVGSLITKESEFSKKNLSQNKQTTALPATAKKIEVSDVLMTSQKEQKLSLIIKADSQGSLEAVTNSLTNRPNIEIVLQAVGDIHKSDIFLAKITKSIIIGFSVNVSPEEKELAKQEKIIIKTYNIIYNLLDELQEVSDLLLEKQQQDKNLKGEAKVLAIFIIDGEKIAGVKITKGKVNLGDSAEIYREKNLIGKTKITSLKIRAKSTTEVKKGQEAGMIFKPQLDIKIGDVVKFIL